MKLKEYSEEPPSNVERVVKEEIRHASLSEWHFHIYFLQNNAQHRAAALALRNAVLKLRRDGAFVAVPLYRVNMSPIGPHTAGSYEIWVPSESFASVYSYLCQHRGELSVLVHPLTREERKDHEIRNSWMGPPFPLDLSVLLIKSEEIPLQYPILKLGYSSIITLPDIEERKAAGRKVEEILKGDEEAAPAPSDD